jgi:PAS domain S-box-containing protein
MEMHNEELKIKNKELETSEEALRAALFYSRNLIETSLDPLVTISAEGRITDVNAATEKITGLSRERLIGSDFSDYFTDTEKARAGYLKAFAQGQVIDYPLAVRHTSGAITEVLYNASVYRNEQGKVIGVFAAARDITERKEIEAGLEKTRQELAVIKIAADEVSEFAESIINTVREPLIALDQDLRVVKVSRSFYDLFKVEPAETMGQLIYDLGNKQWDIPRLRELLETILPQKTTFDNYEVEHDFATIGKRTMLLNARQIQRVLGKERIILLAIEDITERKRAEVALRETQVILQAAMDQSPAGIAIADAPDGKLRYVNDAGLNIRGGDRQSIVNGVGIDNYVASWKLFDLNGKPLQSDEVPLARAVMFGETNSREFIIRRKEGEERIVLGNAAPIKDESGKVVAGIVVFSDITERKLAEEALEKAMADLERSNKDLEQFASIASHDLQEPLRMVASYTQLLAERYEGQLDEKARKYIAYAVEGAIRMQRLVNDLLTYSRVSTRGNPIETADSHSILGEAIRNLAPAIEESKAIVTNEELPMVRADAMQLVQVFQNLLANAIKFRGGNFPHIHVSARDEGREWVFSVRDNGIGIERQYADRIFVIFQRLHTRQEYPGTGIGLAVCKRIVERHGGRIWFESEPGKGSTFLFTVPKDPDRGPK